MGALLFLIYGFNSRLREEATAYNGDFMYDLYQFQLTPP